MLFRSFAQMGAPLVRTKEKTLKKSQHQKDKWIKIKKEIMEKKYPQDLIDRLNFKNMSKEQKEEYIERILETKQLTDKQIEEQLIESERKLKLGFLKRIKEELGYSNEINNNEQKDKTK